MVLVIRNVHTLTKIISSNFNLLVIAIYLVCKWNIFLAISNMYIILEIIYTKLKFLQHTIHIIHIFHLNTSTLKINGEIVLYRRHWTFDPLSGFDVCPKIYMDVVKWF